jgi:hypothetical protein
MRRSVPVIYLALNAACALAMLYAAHRVAAVMALEERTVPDGVDSITFVTGSVVAWVIAALLNVAWIVAALIAVVRRRSGRALWWLGGAVAVWSAAFLSIRFIHP